MNTIDKYLSTENKKTLWSVLYEQGAFSGFNDNEFKSVHNHFESALKSNVQNISPSDDLLNVNKVFIRNMMQNLSSMKQRQHRQQQQGVTNKEISGQRQEELNERLKIHEENLKMMINPKKPGDISFTDENEDTPIGDSMDSLLAEKIAQRNLDLDVPDNSNTDKHVWLDGNASASDNFNTKLPEEKKKVSFVDEAFSSDTTTTESANTLTDNLFSKLKTKPSLEVKEKDENSSEIIERLDKILLRLDTLERAIASINTTQ